MRMLVAAASAAILLSGCQTLQTVDQAVQKNLPQICAAAATAHVAFSVVAETGKLSERTITRESAAFAAVEVICRDPSGFSSATALVTAAQAYAAVAAALREAERVEEAP